MGPPLPYYVGPRATLYLGDCRELSKRLESRSMDLMVADPPYGVGWRSGRRTVAFDAMAGDDGSIDWPAALGEIVRHSLRGFRHVYVFGYKPEELAEPLLLGSAVDLAWDKLHLGPGDLSLPWGPGHELLTFGVHVTRPSGRARGDGRLSARLRRGSVLRVPRVNAGAVVRHPDEKPVALLRALVESSSGLGETVFDPTAGVCSSGVAAVLAGRRWVGIELDESYCALGVDRLREAERIADLAEAV